MICGSVRRRRARAAQRRRLDARTVRVTRQLYYHEKGFKFGPPKSKAGVRTVPFPVSLVFCSSTGTPLSHSNFRRRVWLPALATVGLEGIHVHDLRHTGNQLTANAGANPKELMARMGARQRTGRADLPSLLGGTSAHAG